MDSITKNPVERGRFGWVTAQELTKASSVKIDGDFLARARKYNYFSFEDTGNGSFRYEMKSASAFLREYRKLQS